MANNYREFASPLKILFLTHAFNSLAQRLYVELTRREFDVSVELDISDAVSCEAVTLFQPDLIVAPFLKRAIPATIWQHYRCLIVHPGIIGDRGPSALDWAIMQDQPQWGATILQANAEMDAGDIWACQVFPMRFATKSSLYRREVVEAATAALLQAISRVQSGTYTPTPLNYADANVQGRLHKPILQIDRTINWQCDSTRTVLKKIHAADGFPGVLDSIEGVSYYLYDAHIEDRLRGVPGSIIAKRQNAICRATIDGAIWIGFLKQKSDAHPTFKIAATLALQNSLADVPEIHLDAFATKTGDTYRDIWFEHESDVGYLHFTFYNGAMDTRQCERLRAAYLHAATCSVRVIVLMGGPDFWSNGIHLNHIEYATSPADESWRNINAMNDLVLAIISNNRQLTVAALQGNAGAGGVFLSLAADHIFARASVILNPHYKNMGNLYGSEYWTYLLPRRVSAEQAQQLMETRLPIGAMEAQQLGLIDACYTLDHAAFTNKIKEIATCMATSMDYLQLLEKKQHQRQIDEQYRPLQSYRTEELQRMKLNFYGFDPSYHVARYHFVYKRPHAWTPRYLAKHRNKKGHTTAGV